MSESFNDLDQLRFRLLNNFFTFTQFFFGERTGRKFIVSQPASAESHFVTIANTLVDVFAGKITRLIINLPPGWGKSELLRSFICWGMARYPDANHLYISYSHELAAAHTQTIREIMSLPIYRNLFGVSIRRDSSAKDFFKTTQGGSVAAFGSSGAITGRDAGLPGLMRYSGGVFIDDIHKPDEVHSDTIREKVKRNYFETIEPRIRGYNVPIVLIGQRLHEDDLCAHLLRGADGQHWNTLIIRALDDAGNSRYPEVMTRERLITMSEKQRYVFASQYQQDPQPAGGALYRTEDFPLLDQEPDNILATFVTADTAETDKEWNDKTVFSFWGLYQIKFKNELVPSIYGLHWLDCVELSVEPKDIEDEFLNFWATCMRYPIKPQLSIIEKKSTGVTLVSVLKRMQGIKVIGIDRTVASGSKSQRFINLQQYIANKQVSLPTYGKHTKMCLDHMLKITANDTHRHDDIADTAYDAVRAALIDKIIIARLESKPDYENIAHKMAVQTNRVDSLRKQAHGRPPTHGRVF